jgi:hypothetical protein
MKYKLFIHLLIDYCRIRRKLGSEFIHNFYLFVQHDKFLLDFPTKQKTATGI